MSIVALEGAGQLTRIVAWWSAWRHVPLSADPGFVVALTVVLWFEGVRRLTTARADASDILLLRRPLAGAWRVVMPRRWNGFFVASWWSPLLSAAVFELGVGDDSDAHSKRISSSAIEMARTRRRLRRVAPAVAVLRVIGIVLLFTIAIGLPVSARSYGMSGFVLCAALAMELIIMQIAVASFALRRLGTRWGSTARQALPLLSPFAAPHACEVVWRATLEPDGTHTRALLVARAVMGDARFAQWARPLAYDLVSSRLPDDRIAMRLTQAFREVFEHGYATRIVSDAPLASANAAEAGAYCPRCGALYASAAVACADCFDVPLVPSRGVLAARAS